MDVGDSVGSFALIDKIGAGGMGAVYLAQHKLIGRRAAVKVLLPELSSDPDITARFFNEAKAATAIQHPSIVTIFDFGHHESGCAYIVMEFLDGESLTARMRRAGKLPPEHAISLTRQIAGALGAAHAKGIVHRDMKPDNVMLVPDPEVLPFGERVKVLDFGIAKLISESGGTGNKTRTGSVVGTPAYMAPEQCKGTGQIDHRADVYSLGCMLFEFMSGRTPFVSDGYGELIAAHIFTPAPLVTQFEASVPEPLAHLIARMLGKNPDERPKDMAAVIHELDALGPSWATTAAMHAAAGTMGQMGQMGSGPIMRPTPPPGVGTGPRMPAFSPPQLPTVGQRPGALGSVPAMSGGGTAVLSPDQAPDVRKPTTLGGAASEAIAPAVGKKKSKMLPIAIGGGVLAAAAVAAIVMMGGSKKNKGDGEGSTVAAGGGGGSVDTSPSASPSASPTASASPSPSALPVLEQVTLVVESDPVGAEVYRAADGMLIGKTPFKHKVTKADGMLVYLVKMTGYNDERVELRADEDSTKLVALTAVKKGGPTGPVASTGPKPSKTPKPSPTGGPVASPTPSPSNKDDLLKPQ